MLSVLYQFQHTQNVYTTLYNTVNCHLMIVQEPLPVLKFCNSVPGVRTSDSWDLLFSGISKCVSIDIEER